MLNTGLITKERNEIRISTEGFQFLMADVSEQIITLLVHYLMTIDETVFTKVLRLIFCLSFSSPGQFYSLNGFDATEKVHLKALGELGLLYLTKVSNTAGFVPTKLALAISYTGETPLMLTKEDGFLIIETNYKVYAYTNSPLHISVLSLIMNTKTTFPNLIYGQLSQDSVQQAFKKGITAAQVIRFLNSSAHPVLKTQAHAIPPTIVDQINLWEMDRNRLRAKPGYMYRQFLSQADFEKTLAEGNRIGAILYANSGSRILVVSETGHAQIKAFVKANI